MTKRPQPAPSDAPKEGPVPVEKVGRILLTVLEKQGLAVVIVGFVIGWITGWIPFRLCEPMTSNGQVIQAMERDRQKADASADTDRRQWSKALEQIAVSAAATTEAIVQINARDAIKTCASIGDKDARLACIQVAVRK